MSRRIGWWLMGCPCGYKRVWGRMIRFGPYRLGAWLVNR